MDLISNNGSQQVPLDGATNNYSTLISLKDIWCDKLDQPAIEAVAFSCSFCSSSEEPLLKDVIKTRDSLSDKERLVDNV